MDQLFQAISTFNINIPKDKTDITSKILDFLSKYFDGSDNNYNRGVQFLSSFQDDFKQNDRTEYEIHIMLDEDNNLFDCSINHSGGGHLTNKMVNYTQNNNSHLIHNHPSGGSLSRSDWATLSAHNNLTMTAVNHFGSIFIGRAKSTSLLIDAKDIFDSFEAKISAITSFTESLNKLAIDSGFEYAPVTQARRLNEIKTSVNHELGLILNEVKLVDYCCTIDQSDSIHN
ncbi:MULTISPECIES: hypothetical protein [Providencia]|uniref:hypothetical protein n=1 Tax=Providencia TaxID=586 RepID=UPI00313C7D22